MAHRTLRGGHFIQEDDPAGFAAAIAEVARTAASGA
jgi:haloalkane dehalogenase